MIDGLLARYGLTRENLSFSEIQTLEAMARAVKDRSITVPDVIDFVDSMIRSLEDELANDDPTTFFGWWLRRDRDRSRKARLKNLLILRRVLVSPQEAQKDLERAIKNVVS
jgi:hypothetical protein